MDGTETLIAKIASPTTLTMEEALSGLLYVYVFLLYYSSSIGSDAADILYVDIAHIF